MPVPGLDGPATPAAAGQKSPSPGCCWRVGNPPCNNRPGLNDERLAVQNLRRQLYVCIAETCGLTPDLASIMLTCGNPNCFAPDNPAEQTAVR